MSRTIAVDFDGVIHAYRQGWHDGSIYDEPMPGAFDGLRTLMACAAVFVHTTRESVSVATWLVRHGRFVCATERSGWLTTWRWQDNTALNEESLPVGVDVVHDRIVFWDRPGVLLVTNRKLPAVAYLDDRAVRFESWPQALDDLREPG